MENWLEKFQRLIVLTLLVFMSLAVLISTIEVGVILWKQLLRPPFLLLDVTELLEVFGIILMVVIGLELLETIKAYLNHHTVHVEVVLLAALVAVVRKVIILDYKEFEADMFFAVAALVLALAGSYFIVRRSFKDKE